MDYKCKGQNRGTAQKRGQVTVPGDLRISQGQAAKNGTVPEKQ